MEHRVKYKNMYAAYDSETADNLMKAHGLDLEQELLNMMKAEYEYIMKDNAGVAQG